MTYQEAKMEFAKQVSKGDYEKAFKTLELLEKFQAFIKELREKGMLEEYKQNQQTSL
jgi:hypothetical protein